MSCHLFTVYGPINEYMGVFLCENGDIITFGYPGSGRYKKDNGIRFKKRSIVDTVYEPYFWDEKKGALISDSSFKLVKDKLIKRYSESLKYERSFSSENEFYKWLTEKTSIIDFL